jgi:hypothetical protein
MGGDMANKQTVKPPDGTDDLSWTELPHLRTIGTLADVVWLRGPVTYTDHPGRGYVTCDACVSGADHETYQPVRDYRPLVGAFLGLRKPADVLAFIERYGFLTNRHGTPPARVLVAEVLFQAADLSELRRLLLQTPSHRLLDDAQLRDRAEVFIAARDRAFDEAARAGTSIDEQIQRAAAQVPSLSLDAHWRDSASASSWRSIARQGLTTELQHMDIRWRTDPDEAVVELVPTSLLQLVVFGMLLEARGDERLNRCLECNRPLGERDDKPGRPRIYCLPDPATGRDCSRAAWNRSRRETRRVARG